ncbi:MAG TPA: YtxH domain-containing protein [Anaerolineae bacterium]
MNDDNRGWEFLAGFLLGGIVGAAAALLFAPASGEETRETLRERGIELKSRANEMTADSQKRAAELTEQARKRATEAQERARLAVEDQRSRLQDAIEEGKTAAAKRKDDLLSRFEADRKS